MFISLWLQIWVVFRHQGLVISSTMMCLYLFTGCTVSATSDMAVFFCVKVPVFHKWYVTVLKMRPNTWYTDQNLYSTTEHLRHTFIWTVADKEIYGSCFVLSPCQEGFILLVHRCAELLHIEVMEGSFHPLWRWLSVSESIRGLWMFWFER